MKEHDKRSMFEQSLDELREQCEWRRRNFHRPNDAACSCRWCVPNERGEGPHV